MSTPMNSVSTTRESTTAQLITDLKKVADDANLLIKEVATYPTEKITSARAQLQEKLQVVKTRVGDLRDATEDRTRHIADATHDYVVDNPWKSLGIAAIAATAVALLIKDRTHH